MVVGFDEDVKIEENGHAHIQPGPEDGRSRWRVRGILGGGAG